MCDNAMLSAFMERKGLFMHIPTRSYVQVMEVSNAIPQDKEDTGGSIINSHTDWKGETQNKMSPENSDYDSADSYSDDQNVKLRSKASDHEEGSNSEAGSLSLEREEGDGQESVPARKVDDDEDKKNPQYIPKRGTFYEHDDRTAEDEEIKVIPEEEKDKDGKKKVWQDKKEKWSHDRFNESEQSPKTKAELVNIYGYDIRNEDGPPRARRRRRYGRGPNKYTRNWEDEDAYTKPQPTVPRKKNTRPRRDGEEFPPLIKNPTSDGDVVKDNGDKRKQEVPARKSEERSDAPKDSTDQPQTSTPTERLPPPVNDHQNTNKTNQQQRVGSGRMIKPNGFTARTADNRKFTAKLDHHQQKPTQPPKSSGGGDGEYVQSQNFTNKKNLQDLEKEMNKLSVDGVYRGSGGGGNKPYHTHRQGGSVGGQGGGRDTQRQGSVPPRLQSESQKGSKRYSSMRQQRSLPEANNPPLPANYHSATSFYASDYNQQPPPPMHQNSQILPPSNAQVPPQLAAPPMQVPVTAAAPPLLQPPFAPPPPHAFPQPPPAAAFLQPGVPATPFIPPQTTQLINYVQGQAAFSPNFQGFAPQQFNPVTQPAELYQPQGGITYYSTDQQLGQRQVPQKRPKAAIPIVAPPGNDKKDDNAINNQNFLVEASGINEVFDAQQ